MAEYKSEFVKIKFDSEKAERIEGSVSQFDALVNARAKEGWELAAYSCTAAPYSVHGFLVTFKKV